MKTLAFALPQFVTALSLLMALISLLTPAHAGPMGFKDSVMAMGDFSSNWVETWANYAVTPRDAVGAGLIYMRSDDERLTRKVADANYTRLFHRWNLPHAQANVWFVGGLGGVRGNDFSGTRTFISPGVQVDYETTRLYLSSNVRLYRAEGLKHDYAAVRTGFSFYEADYDQTQPWLIVEARRMRGLSEKIEVTPMIRLIHKRYFIEAGWSNNQEARFNFMYIF